MDLRSILDLVGKLDDTNEVDVPRERFRRYLNDNIIEPGQIRDYVSETLRENNPQYNRAFQDLINLTGKFLGFEVDFGRYSGVSNEIGFDGHWVSPENFHIVVEVKTSEIFNININTLLNYINQLISEGKIPNKDSVLGLYVIGNNDPEINQVKNSIVGEKRSDEIRLISSEQLISLSELMNVFDISHKDILSILKPSGPSIDSTIQIMSNLAYQSPYEEIDSNQLVVENENSQIDNNISYWMTPVKANNDLSAGEIIQSLVGEEELYAFRKNTPGRKRIKIGDKICFYEARKGVVAHADIASKPENKIHKSVHSPEEYDWVFKLKNPILYLENPIIIDENKRKKLNAFKGKDHSKNWAWFVQSTKEISYSDFYELTIAKKF